MKLVKVERSLWMRGGVHANFNKVTGHHWFYLKSMNVCIDSEGEECTYETAYGLLIEARQIVDAMIILET